MSGLIPKATINVFRTFNDLGVKLYGIPCILYVPTNLTALEPNDMYTAPSTITYKMYDQIPVWVEWFVKDLHRLRKLGIFIEGETPILARFPNVPEVILGSYIKVETQYIPDDFDIDEFEVVDVLMSNTYTDEIYRWFKLAPRRAANTIPATNTSTC